MSKLFKIGMYGGAFCPMHLGHLHCVEVASKECEKVYLILFYGGDKEDQIHEKYPARNELTLNERIKQVYRVASHFDNVEPVVIDISKCRFPDRTENWDLETDLVLNVCGHIDAAYGSEPQYADYFYRAYPGCQYRCLDPDRKFIHISSTEIRKMPYNERKEWMV